MRSKKYPIDLKWENGVSILAHSFLIESSSKLLVLNQERHKSSDEFDFRPLVSMAHLYIFKMRFDLGTLDASERLLPFGLLVIIILLTFRMAYIIFQNVHFSIRFVLEWEI